MNLNSKWLYVLCLSPLLGFLFPGLAWAQDMKDSIPDYAFSSRTGTVICPQAQQIEVNQATFCPNLGVVVNAGNSFLLIVSPVEDERLQSEPSTVVPDSQFQFPHPLSDPYRGFPVRDIPAGVIGH